MMRVTMIMTVRGPAQSIVWDALVFESEAPMVSVEIGHGSVLIRHPSSMAREVESETSSLSVDHKTCRPDEGYSNPASLLSPYDSKSVNNSCTGMEKVRKLGQITQLEQAKSSVLSQTRCSSRQITINLYVKLNSTDWKIVE